MSCVCILTPCPPASCPHGFDKPFEVQRRRRKEAFLGRAEKAPLAVPSEVAAVFQRRKSPLRPYAAQPFDPFVFWRPMPDAVGVVCGAMGTGVYSERSAGCPALVPILAIPAQAGFYIIQTVITRSLLVYQLCERQVPAFPAPEGIRVRLIVKPLLTSDCCARAEGLCSRLFPSAQGRGGRRRRRSRRPGQGF